MSQAELDSLDHVGPPRLFVDIVAAHEEEQGAGKELQCVTRPIKIPDGGRRPETHGVVEPEGRP